MKIIFISITLCNILFVVIYEGFITIQTSPRVITSKCIFQQYMIIACSLLNDWVILSHQQLGSEWSYVLKSSIFHLGSSNIAHFQLCVIPLSISPTLDCYRLTDCSKTRPSHIINILLIQISLLCFLLSVLGLDVHP